VSGSPRCQTRRCLAAAGAAAAALLQTPAPAAPDPAAPFPVAEGTGFVWTAPKSAKCEPVRPADARACVFSPSGAFGLPLAYHTCRRSSGGELLVFRSMPECREALETMRANAP
jgi:hypothetical protein